MINPDVLLDYQQEDILRLHQITGDFNGSLNFNCRGSGKTLESIAQAITLGAQLVIIFCPNRLKYNWQEEITKWTGEESVITHSEYWKTWRDWFPKTGKLTGRKTLANTRWFITNIEKLRSEKNLELFNSMLRAAGNKGLVIIDEAHRLRNDNASQTQGAYELRKQTKKLLLTGTPVVNTSLDVYPLLHLVDPTRFNDIGLFRHTFTEGYMFRGEYRATENKNQKQLRGILQKRSIERTKKEILPNLPPLIRERVTLEMSNAQEAVYKPIEKNLEIELADGSSLWAGSTLAIFTRCRQLLTDPRIVGASAPSVKTETLKELIQEEKHSVVFTEFEQYVSLVTPELISEGWKVGRITGKESPEQANIIARNFQNGQYDVLICTIKSMSEGLNLYAGQQCIFMSKWWNPATNQQAEDRLHRIGLQHPVRAVNLYVGNTIDDLIEEVLKTKEETMQELTKAEISDLVRERLTTLSWAIRNEKSA